MRSLLRKTHKYLGFFISLQLLLWTISGIFFSFNQIEAVRGEQYRKTLSHSLDLGKFDFKSDNLRNVRWVKRIDQDVIIMSSDSGVEYRNMKGENVSKISFDEARQIVTALTTLIPQKVEEIVNMEKRSEYRGRSLPLYKVTTISEDETILNVYLNPFSGEIAAIRSSWWRIWDLMWGFHIMDWEKRDDFNNLLLKIFSVLALITASSGLLLFFRFDLKKEPRNFRLQ